MSSDEQELRRQRAALLEAVNAKDMRAASHMAINSDSRFWTRWRRGVSVLWRAYLILFAAYLIFYIAAALGSAALEPLGQPWRAIPGVTVGLPVLAVLVLYFPVLVSEMQADAASIKERVAMEVEPRIDAVGEALGVQWDQHYISQVGQLLESGDSVRARRAYQNHSGAS